MHTVRVRQNDGDGRPVAVAGGNGQNRLGMLSGPVLFFFFFSFLFHTTSLHSRAYHSFPPTAVAVVSRTEECTLSACVHVAATQHTDFFRPPSSLAAIVFVAAFYILIIVLNLKKKKKNYVLFLFFIMLSTFKQVIIIMPVGESLFRTE